ncbi:MAG: alpha/beta hydrolase-fold protein, partial [Bacteroidota bacterium]
MIQPIHLLLLLLISSNVAAQSPISAGEKHTLHSKILGEVREVWIALPENYDANRKYPVIYALDAEWQFDITRSLARELTTYDKIPHHIVVGVPHIDTRHRLKDLTFTTTEVSSDGKPDPGMASFFNAETSGGGMPFYEHLKSEILPFVDSLYSTNGFDVLIGHSLGGYFGAYIMTLNSPFEAYQLFDPSIWYNHGNAIQHFSETLPKACKANVFIASAAGGRNREQYNLDTHQEFQAALVKNGINAQHKSYAEEGHLSVRLPALIDGLTQLYKGYS